MAALLISNIIPSTHDVCGRCMTVRTCITLDSCIDITILSWAKNRAKVIVILGNSCCCTYRSQ